MKYALTFVCVHVVLGQYSTGNVAVGKQVVSTVKNSGTHLKVHYIDMVDVVLEYTM
jgi:hypothetical protein